MFNLFKKRRQRKKDELDRKKIRASTKAQIDFLLKFPISDEIKDNLKLLDDLESGNVPQVLKNRKIWAKPKPISDALVELVKLDRASPFVVFKFELFGELSDETIKKLETYLLEGYINAGEAPIAVLTYESNKKMHKRAKKVLYPPWYKKLWNKIKKKKAEPELSDNIAVDKSSKD